MGGIGYKADGQVARITIEGDNDLNFLSLEMVTAFADALIDFRSRRDLWVAIVSGRGEKAYSAGGDLKGPVSTYPEFFTPKANREWVWWPHEGIRAATGRLVTLELDKPVIAAINGYCLGISFISMLQLTDIRVAGTGATFGLTETRQGLCGGAASGQLTRHLPRAVAMHMVLTGRSITAEDALRWGLVTKVVPPGDVMAEADSIAADICELPIEVVKAEKEGAVRAHELTREGAFRLAQMLYTIQVQEPGVFDRAENFLKKKARLS